MRLFETERIRDTDERCPSCRMAPARCEVWCDDKWLVIECELCYRARRRRESEQAVLMATTGSAYRRHTPPLDRALFAREWRVLEDQAGGRKRSEDVVERYWKYLNGRITDTEFRKACHLAFVAGAGFPSPADLVALGRS